MALSKDFKFSDVPAAQNEAERRAILMFGASWRDVCVLCKDRRGSSGISFSEKTLSFEGQELVSWTNGERQDLDDWSPANVSYYLNGSIAFLEHYCDGIRCDAADGGPGLLEYYPSGGVKAVTHYSNGTYENTADGLPARVFYSDAGEVTSGLSRTENGLTRKELSADEAVAMIKAAQVYRVAALLKTADQSVAPAGMPLPETYVPSAADIKSKIER